MTRANTSYVRGLPKPPLLCWILFPPLDPPDPDGEAEFDTPTV